jgi:hypothetical protein
MQNSHQIVIIFCEHNCTTVFLSSYVFQIKQINSQMQNIFSLLNIINFGMNHFCAHSVMPLPTPSGIFTGNTNVLLIHHKFRPKIITYRLN